MTDTKPKRKRRTKAQMEADRAEAARLAGASPAVELPAAGVAEARRAGLVAAVQNAPVAAPTPSVAAATVFHVEPENYSKREQGQAKLAMDFNGASMNALSFVEASGWPGFSTLALLGQLAEYRVMHEALADECVRKWGRVVTSGNSDPQRIRDIEAELERLNLKAVVRQMVVDDQAYGGAHAFFKMKGDDGDVTTRGERIDSVRELPLVAKPYTVRKGSFEAIRVVEPRWVTPNDYNAIDPSRADFYKPVSWWMLSVKVHASRLYTIVSRPVSDILKPTYSFRGISLTQLAMPYVDNWLRTRQSVSDTTKQFSVSGIKTDLAQQLAPGAGTDLQMRASLINAYRDNRNLLFLDTATEDFFQVNTPLTGLDALQAQSQEHMSAVSQTPLVKLTGITPAGLNASSDGEIRVWYDRVGGYCKNVLGPFIARVLELTQLSLDGTIDEHLSWEWNPLHELTALEEADRRAKDADTAARYIEATVITPEQEAERLANDPTSGYAGILNRPASPDDFEDTDVAGIVNELLEPMAEEATNGTADAGQTVEDPAADPVQPLG